MIDPLSAVYGAAAAWRRRWYAADPSRQRRLARPVISVGNLRVGGSGKTPIVEYVARPERFVSDVAAAGWQIVGTMTFRDHYVFTQPDVARIAAAARAAASAIVLTTEKDAVRLAACDLGDMPVASVPLEVGVEPADAFREWLFQRLGIRTTIPA